MATSFQLLISSEGSEARSVPIDPTETTIGSQPGNTVQLSGDGVSRVHAKLMHSRGKFVLYDAGSTHGILLQGRRISVSPIAPGQEFRIGPYVLVIVPESAPATPEAPASLATPAAEPPRPTGVRPPTVEDPLVAFQQMVRGFMSLSTVMGITDLQVSLETLLERSMSFLHAERGFVVLVQGSSLSAVVTRSGLAPAAGEGFSRTVCERAVAQREPILITSPDSAEIDRIESLRMRHPGMVLGVPFIHGTGVNGVLYLESEQFLGPGVRERMKLLKDLAQLGGQILAVALERRQLTSDSERWRWLAATASDFPDLFRASASAPMKEVGALVTRVAAEDVTALILGESGTGKEVVARTIHQLSSRRDGPFVAVNCGAIPRELMEGELFGHERGAFTGAAVRKLGRLELAQGGTLLLDELGELPKDLQVKLLRVLETRHVERIGGKDSIPWDARVLAATNRDLKAAIQAGEFREDLYYRLDVISIRLPPLRERREDIEALVGEMLVAANRRFRRKLCGVEPAALAALASYDWPGNVRELKNIIERAFVLETEDRLTLASLPFPPATAPAPAGPGAPPPPALPETQLGSLAEFVRKQEISYIRLVLAHAGGSVTRAAEILELNRSALHKKMRHLGIRGGQDEES